MADRPLINPLSEASAREILRERVKELECLYGISRALHRTGIGIDQMFREVAEVLPRGFQYPESAAVRISYARYSFRSPTFSPSPFMLSAPLTAGGCVEVAYPPEIVRTDPSPFLLEERQLIEKAATDISLYIERTLAAQEKERLEARLHHADRLATVGIMASGMAHELNEPLAAILGFAQLVAKAPGLPDQASRDAQRIVDACLRARQTVQGLLVFSGRAPARREDCDLAGIVREGIVFLEPRCRTGGITLRLDLADGVPLVRADPAQLLQVLVNLVVNAVQAMPAGGSLGVSTAAEGATAVLSVEDTGIGMSPETLDRIFVPFFTTKGVGLGTGLGLAVVHGIVLSLGGKISVQSTVGKGSRFKVRLPGSTGPSTGETGK